MALKSSDKILPPNFKNIPNELKQQKRWLLWQARPILNKPGEVTKVPVTIDGIAFSGWNNPQKLYSFEQVKSSFQSGKYAGIGFVLIKTDFICLDLDNTESTESISSELTDLIRFGYTEISPSGRGYHVWIKGIKPKDMGKVGYTASGEKLEVFGDSGWVTVTGNSVNSVPIKEDQPLIMHLYYSYFQKGKSNRQICKSRESEIAIKDQFDLDEMKKEMLNGPEGQKIRELWDGDISPYDYDHSRADFALCRYLARYTNADYMSIDRLFRQSKLYRPKWDERRGDTTYGGMTITKAMNWYMEENSDANGDSQKIEYEYLNELVRINQEMKNNLLDYIKNQEKINQKLVQLLDDQQSVLEKQIKQLTSKKQPQNINTSDKGIGCFPCTNDSNDISDDDLPF